MNLSISISGQKLDEIKVAIRRHDTGHSADTPELKEFHRRVCDILEPAIYEAVRGMVSNSTLNTATVLWDGETLSLKRI